VRGLRKYQSVTTPVVSNWIFRIGAGVTLARLEKARTGVGQCRVAEPFYLFGGIAQYALYVGVRIAGPKPSDRQQGLLIDLWDWDDLSGPSQPQPKTMSTATKATRVLSNRLRSGIRSLIVIQSLPNDHE
jgi:hypothetical protein